MNKSLLVFFAVIAAASAIRLPIDIKVAVDRLEKIHHKDVKYESVKVPEGTYESKAMADVVPEGTYESEAMADVVPEGTYEIEAVADVVPEGTYESEAMADVVPEGTYESEAMADEVPEVAAIVPHPPVALNSIRERIENLRQVPEVPEEVHFESEHMADPVFETKDMADQPFETVAMKDEYENEAITDERPALLQSVIEKIESIVQKESPEVAQEEVQEAEKVADSFYGNADLSEQEFAERRALGEEKFAKIVAAIEKLAQYF